MTLNKAPDALCHTNSPPMYKKSDYLSTFTIDLFQPIRAASLRATSIRPFYCSTVILQARMLKRKRITAASAKLLETLSTPKVEREKHDVADRLDGGDEEKDFEPELTPTEEEFDPELNGNEKKKKKGKRNKTASVKTTPEKKLVCRREGIKTEDENGYSIVREPQVNSNYLPLPWKGRLGYVSPPPINSNGFPTP